MRKLVFTADGRLREQTPEALDARPPGALARIVAAPGAATAQLLAGEREYQIVPSAHGGDGFELRDGEGARSGGFQPFRLRRGGHLRVRETGMSLHGRPWSHEGWAFSLADGRTVEATIVPGQGFSAHGDGALAVAEALDGDRPEAGSFVVVLEAVASLPLIALAEALALGSWLIARWHVTPAVDHVLASVAAGAGREAGG